jgi:hypothetical protein
MQCKMCELHEKYYEFLYFDFMYLKTIERTQKNFIYKHIIDLENV